METLNKEKDQGQSFHDLQPLLESTTASLRESCDRSLHEVRAILSHWNDTRWFRRSNTVDPTGQQACAARIDVLSRLTEEIEMFRFTRRAEMLKPFEKHFDVHTGALLDSTGHDIPNEFSAASVFLCLSYTTDLIGYAEALRDLLDRIVQAESQSPRNKLQLPTKFVKNAASVLTQEEGSRMAFETDAMVSPDQLAADQTDRRRRYDPDADTSRNGIYSFTRALSNAWRWQTSPDGLFVLRYAVVSMLLWLPSVLESSAWFSYSNKILWALIMAVSTIRLAPARLRADRLGQPSIVDSKLVLASSQVNS